MSRRLSLVVMLLCGLVAGGGCPSRPAKPAAAAPKARPASDGPSNPIIRSYRDALLVGASAALERRVRAVGIGGTAAASGARLTLTIVDHGARVLGPLVLKAAASDDAVSAEARALAAKLEKQLRALPPLVDTKGLDAALKTLSQQRARQTARQATAIVHTRLQQNGGKADATANAALTVVSIIKLVDRTLALYQGARGSGSVEKLPADGHVVASVASLVWSARSTTAAKPAFDAALRLLERIVAQARRAH